MTIAPFSADYAPDDATILAPLLAADGLPPDAEARVEALARDLIAAIRAHEPRLGDVESILREYALSTKEGLALMVLAEALLRVPDADTADRLIEEKLGGFTAHVARSDDLTISAMSWALGFSARILTSGETPASILATLRRRIGMPAIRAAARQAMRILGHHFVLGETIEDALRRAGTATGRRSRYSFDMLGEGARTASDASAYATSYANAISAIGRAAGSRPFPERPGLSIKLSALHPRYEALSESRVLAELVPILRPLVRQARAYDLNVTIDAEEADRLELSLDVFAAVLADPTLAGWDGFGLAIQAYQKRCLAVIDHVAALAAAHDRRLMIRLVKGAYWDGEIKRAQERGLADYPVFTRKSATDLVYLAAAQKLLDLRPRLYPQFATHNALTVASVIAHADGVEGYEFQRLHGMGDALYARLLTLYPQAACRIYAPVGGHRDLLAYLVRRLLENGAASSFVWQAADPDRPVETLLRRPAEQLAKHVRHPNVPKPRDLFAPDRINSTGVEFGARRQRNELSAAIEAARRGPDASSLIDGHGAPGPWQTRLSPIDGKTIVGQVRWATDETVAAARLAARRGALAWGATSVERRARALENAADALEADRAAFLHLLQVEAGKTIEDAVAELREAVDFCRYYAAEARKIFADPQSLKGPTGEDNRIGWRPRGVIVAISPWNFPLAIFIGQIAAALVAGNAVIAKPAEQTPLVAWRAAGLLHRAGVNPAALHLVLGDGTVGAALVGTETIDGVVFTGSTEVAQQINRGLAAKDGAIVPLIAETGGINAMIADATALPEQVTDDVVTSAFRSAGQRCSALRLLLVQEDIADRVFAMIAGAVRELKVGDPRDLSVHIGPVIDAEAKTRLDDYAAEIRGRARPHLTGVPPASGTYVMPQIYEIDDPRALTREIFGPILHVVRYRADRLDAVIDALAASGWGLTLGIHSRIEATIARIIARLPTGNIYVNRNMIGAVVGVQPFGGCGRSGTGPKAGGPHYLTRFATEQTVTVNTAAVGGNAALIALGEG